MLYESHTAPSVFQERSIQTGILLRMTNAEVNGNRKKQAVGRNEAHNDKYPSTLHASIDKNEILDESIEFDFIRHLTNRSKDKANYELLILKLHWITCCAWLATR